MEIVIIWDFSNYFNRTVKRLETVEQYKEARPFFSIPKVNGFTPNDGVSTEQIVNLDIAGNETFRSNGDPDYLIVVDDRTDERPVVSRWYIRECLYVRALQYRLILRRDVVADYYYAVMSATCLVERGPLSAESPLIYNQEPGAVNQIKRSETLLKDQSGKAWIVGYVSRDTSALSDIQAETQTSADYPELSDLGLAFNDPADPAQGATFEGMGEEALYKALFSVNVSDDPLGLPLRKAYLLSKGNDLYGIAEQNAVLLTATAALTAPDSPSITSSNWTGRAWNAATYWNASVVPSKATLDSKLCDRLGIASLSDTMEVREAATSNQVFHDSDSGKYYRLFLVSSTSEVIQESAKDDDKPALYQQLRYIASNAATRAAIAGDSLDFDGSARSDETYMAEVRKTTLSIALVETAPSGVVKVSVPSSRRNLTDAPYDMFCMEFDQDNLALAQALVTFPIDPDNEKKRIFDLQILPYCPRTDVFDDAALAAMEEGKDFEKIYESDGNGGWTDTGKRMFWCLKSSASLFIELSLQVPRGAGEYPPESVKIADKCDLYRLTSPNYASSYEFSVAKNGGVRGFRVDFTYKPISPYIHVAPFFGGLYGDVNDDARGLICGGDFSVDMVSDAWTEYQTQNKNYENIFNTRIKSMDDRRMFDRVGSAVGIAGSVLGAAAGGSRLLGPAGGAVAAASAAAGGLFGMASSEAKYEIDRAAQIATYKYELANVIALPDTLTKVSAYNVNNKYFPIVEKYSCTDEERKAFREYVRHFNFRVGVMTTIGDVLANRFKPWEYVRGDIVIIQTAYGLDPHVAGAIYEEIHEGVYFL